MKYNKRESEAIETLETVLEGLKTRTTKVITEGECKSVKDCLGWDILNTTYRAKDAKKLVTEKEEHLLEIRSYTEEEARHYNYYVFFPFQAKD